MWGLHGDGSILGCFPAYLESVGKDEEGLQADLQKRFQHIGPSTVRMFLWTVGYKLTPNAKERKPLFE